MRRLRKEKVGAPRQVWCYDGRQIVQGVDCYVWQRYLDVPEPGTGFTGFTFVAPVADFWPAAFRGVSANFTLKEQ